MTNDAAPTEYQTRVSLNAARLLADAKLLCQHERYPSAFALAVLGLEEVGKLILDCWHADSSSKRASAHSHLKKQYAVAALIMAKRIAEEDDRRDGKSDEQFSATLVETFLSSEEADFQRYVAGKVIDRAKQISLYIGGLPSAYDRIDLMGFGADDVSGMIDRANKATFLLLDAKVVFVGRALFESHFKKMTADEQLTTDGHAA